MMATFICMPLDGKDKPAVWLATGVRQARHLCMYHLTAVSMGQLQSIKTQTHIHPLINFR